MKRAYMKYIAGLLIFGFNGIIASQIDLSSYNIVLLRSAIGVVMLLLLFLLGRGHFHIKEHKKDLLFIALSGIGMGANWMFLYEGYDHVGVGVAILFCYCGPVIVMMLSPLFFKERLTAPKVIGFLAVLAGFLLVNKELPTAQDGYFGIFCGVMSALAYAVLVMANKKAEHITGMENAVIQMFFTLMTVFIFVLFKNGCHFTVAPEDWGWILLIGIVNTGLAVYLYLTPISVLPVQTVAVCGYIEPLSAVIFAAVLLGEVMAPLQILGAVLILGGAIFGEWFGNKRLRLKS